jgi:hypothetical protein
MGSGKQGHSKMQKITVRCFDAVIHLQAQKWLKATFKCNAMTKVMQLFFSFPAAVIGWPASSESRFA